MAIAGAPIYRQDHVEPGEPRFDLRVGLACGSIVAGVVGTSKFTYDVWGGACNLASRMESTGSARRIQVSSQVFEAARYNPAFRFVKRGEVHCKVSMM
jgi:adenylate cyclase